VDFEGVGSNRHRERSLEFVDARCIEFQVDVPFFVSKMPTDIRAFNRGPSGTIRDRQLDFLPDLRLLRPHEFQTIFRAAPG